MLKNRKIKVLHILFSGLGGHGNVFFSFVAADNKNQLENSALFYGVDALKSEYVEKCHFINIPFHYVHKRKGFDLTSYWRIIKTLFKARPEVVLLHSTNAIIPVRIAAFFTNIKIVAVEHSPNQVKTKFEWIYSQLCMLWAKEIVVLSDAYKEELKEYMGSHYNPEKVSVVPNGIDIEFFSSSCKESSKETLRIGMLARISTTKDHGLLVDAFSTLREKAYFNRIELLIAGDGDLKEALMNKIDKLGLNNRVKLTGMLNEEGSKNFLDSLDIYVHASKGEAMSTSVMQALSMGLPCIGTDISGINNIMRGGKDSLLVPLGDSDKLANAIDRLVMDEKKRLTMGVHARKNAEENLSHFSMFNRYLTVIDKLTQ